MSEQRQDSVRAKHTAHYMQNAPAELVATRIASHYLSCANLAFDLRTLTAVEYEGEMPKATQDAILHMRKEIERHHLEAFGTAIIQGERDE